MRVGAFVTYEDIYAWQEGRELVRLIYSLTQETAAARDFGLKDQIQRAAVSVCSNIAEGFERRGNKEFIKFLWIAKGSAAEVSSQLYHFKDLGHISDEQFRELYDKTKSIRAALYKLIKSITDSNHTLEFTKL